MKIIGVGKKWFFFFGAINLTRLSRNQTGFIVLGLSIRESLRIIDTLLHCHPHSNLLQSSCPPVGETRRTQRERRLIR